jgi:WD40 repeat protein
VILRTEKGLSVWNYRAGIEEALLEPLGEHRCAAASAEGRLVAAGYGDGTVRAWEVPKRQLLWDSKLHAGSVTCLTFSRDGRLGASGGDDGAARLWNPADGALVQELVGHDGEIESLAFCPDGSEIVTLSRDNSLRFWDCVSGRCRLLLRGEFEGPPTWSPDGRRLAIPSFNLRLEFLDAHSGDAVAALPCWSAGVQSYSADGSSLLCLSEPQFTVWDIDTLQRQGAWEDDSQDVVALLFGTMGSGKCRGYVYSGDWAVDAQRVLVACLTGCFSANARAVEPRVALSWVDWPSGVRFSRKGTILVAYGFSRAPIMNHPITVWDAERWEPIARLGTPGDVATSADVTAEGDRIVAGFADGMVRTFDARTGQVLHVLTAQEKMVRSVAISPNGEVIASAAAEAKIVLWDAATGKQLHALTGPSGEFLSVAFSPCGKRLASGSSDGSVRWWDVETGSSAVVLAGHQDKVNCVAFSPDGAWIASAGEDGRLALSRSDGSDDGALLGKFVDPLRSLDFSPDGRQIVAGLPVYDESVTDVVVHLCDVETRTIIATFELGDALGESEELCVAFSPDGGRIVAEAGSTLYVWESDAASLERLKRARRRIDRIALLFREHLFPDGVVAAIEGDASIPPEERQALSRIARLQGNEDAWGLELRSWHVVRGYGAPAAHYERALREAEAAVKIGGERPVYLKTLGAALYRVGRFEEAVKVLQACEAREVEEKGRDDWSPEVCACERSLFQALSLKRLGRDAEAAAAYERVKQQWCKQRHVESSLLREVRELLGAWDR